MMADDDPETLTIAQHATLLSQMVLGLIPYVGPVIERSLIGVLQSRRENRVMATLEELTAQLKNVQRPLYVDAEHFQSLLEASLPLIASATKEEKRRAFRNLLLNAAVTSPHDDSVDEADLALRLVSEIDAPGLALIAAFGQLASDTIIVRNAATPFAFRGIHDQDSDKEPPPESPIVELPYAFSVLDEWRSRFVPRTNGGLGLFHVSGVSPKGSFRMTGNDRARLIVRWGYWADS